MKNPIIALAALAASSAAAAPVPIRWTVETSRVAPAAIDAYHGETLRLEASLQSYGRPLAVVGETPYIYWQTNGMGAAYWSAPATCSNNVLRADFTPEMDTGAAVVHGFIGSPGENYRASYTLRFRASPGATPNVLPLPTPTLDFAAVEVLNAPWTDPDYSTNNAALVATIEATAPAPGNYSVVSNRAMTAVQSATKTETFIFTDKMPGFVSVMCVFQTENTFSMFIDGINRGVFDVGGPVDIWSDYYQDGPDTEWKNLINSVVFVGDGLYDINAEAQEVMHGVILNTTVTCITQTRTTYDTATAPYALDLRKDSPILSQLDAATATNALQDTAISTLSDSISNLADEAAPAINGYARLYSFVTGSTNANFVVTNYQLTAEAEASRTHFDPSDPDLDFSTVPPSLRLEDASSGTNRVVVDTRDWTVWYYAQKIGGAMAEAVSTAVDTCRAWCGFTATGLENPAPDTLVVDVPNIWLMAGKTFEKHIAGSNAVWIIRSSGMVMPISDNSQSAGGFLELTDAFGTPYIRFKKTESYFVDPAADGVEYDSATGAWLVTYTTTTCPKGGANAVLEGSTTYPGKAILKDEDDPDCPATITWTGSANNWVMHAVPKQIDGAVPPKMFFAAVVEVQGQDYIEYLRPMSVPSLMFNGATYAPTVNGNKLEFIAQ